MITKLRKRIESEKGFTLIEMLIVIIILGILLAIAVPAYLKFRDRANQSAAKANIRAAIPAMEAYNADNTGATGDADGVDTTTGYQGMTLALLQGYDAAIKGITIVGTSGVSTYCIKGTSGTKSAYKTAASDIVESPACTAPA